MTESNHKTRECHIERPRWWLKFFKRNHSSNGQKPCKWIHTRYPHGLIFLLRRGWSLADLS
jgi:hypothetical protein